MKKGIIILLFSLSLLSCKGKDKEGVVKKDQVEEQEQKKLHWWELPQYVDPKDETYKEVMKGREEKYQQAMKKITLAGTNGIPESGFSESEYSMVEINLMNELYYDELKSMGFQFPSEEIFNKRIKEIYGVDLTKDQSKNPRIRRVGNFLILVPKLYEEKTYKEVPMLLFSYPCIVFDIKRRYYIDSLINTWDILDDYDEVYYRFYMSSADLAYNNYIFYESKAALVTIYPFAAKYFAVIGGNDNLPVDLLKDYQKEKLKEYKEVSARSREGFDYRMYERMFFSRGFNGELKVKKKMLEAAVELASEDDAYIRVPLEYYFRQMTIPFIANEYAAEQDEVNNPFTEREPFYTEKERAMIWVYTALLELNVPSKSSNGIPYTFISLATQYPELYEVAKANNFFGEDMSQVLEYL